MKKRLRLIVLSLAVIGGFATGVQGAQQHRIVGPSSDGSVDIMIGHGPSIKMINGAAEEASGCWGDWPEQKISYSVLRDLHTLHINRTEPVGNPGAPDCHGEMSVESSGLRLVRGKTLPDPDDPTVTYVDCTDRGGYVSLDGVWCV